MSDKKLLKSITAVKEARGRYTNMKKKAQELTKFKVKKIKEKNISNHKEEIELLESSVQNNVSENYAKQKKKKKKLLNVNQANGKGSSMAWQENIDENNTDQDKIDVSEMDVSIEDNFEGDISENEDRTDNEISSDLNKEGTQSNTDTIEREFSTLKGKLSDALLENLEKNCFTKMTEIQSKAIPPLLEGRDLVGSAKTGSGKTLAFVIPCIELLSKLNFKLCHGTGALIISPTRELAMQTYGVIDALMGKEFSQTRGLLVGGSPRKVEEEKLGDGLNIVVATPGRLLDHLRNTIQFRVKNMQCLIIDEADLLLSIGFEEDMKQILKHLPTTRQTMLFSATLSEKTQRLTKLALKKNPIYVGVDDNKPMATVEGLEQGYIVCPTEKRLHVLFTFLKKNRDKKVMVFFSTCMSAKYHYELFNYIDLQVGVIHGKITQTRRTSTFFSFCKQKSGTLFCTDVAARGLDIPDVDWIVQYDPPFEPREYIHRVGRTARGEGGKGRALLFLRPEELGFLKYLKLARVTVNEFEFQWTKICDIQLQLEKLVSTVYELHQSAKEAYQATIRSYDATNMKDVFDIKTLSLKGLGQSLGLKVPPGLPNGIGPNKRRKERLNKMKRMKQDNVKKLVDRPKPVYKLLTEARKEEKLERKLKKKKPKQIS